MISSNKSKGFTLVELLIVIVVIAILAAISIVAYNGVTQKARDDERVATARNIVNAAASYNSEENKWPTHATLKTYNTVKLSGAAADAAKVGDFDVTTEKDKYKYILCKDNDTTTNADEATGVKVEYYKDVASGSDPAGKKEMSTGKCS